MSTIKAWAALEAGGKLQPFNYEMSPITAEEVEIEVEYCGLCHTDLSFIKNESGVIPYPLVAGHEIIGKIVSLGDVAKQKGLSVGQTVGLGWNKESCQHCEPCLEGAQHLCSTIQATIYGNHGGFANRVKAHWIWTIPVPQELDSADAGPLFCAGITVFSPLMEYAIRPTDKIGVFGIGGLGHLAVQFCQAWGSEVTAFSSTEAKYEEIKKMGATHVISSRDSTAWETLQGKFDLIIITVAVTLDWDKIIAMLSPKGRLHFVGIIFEPLPLSVMSLLISQKTVSASPGGSRSSIDKMLRFAALHNIRPIVEHFPMSSINEAIEHMESGKANYRIVLDSDFA